MRLVIIVNEVAGSGKAKRKSDQLQQQLTVPFTVERTEYVGHAVLLAEKYGKEAEQILLLVVGGDGTIHEVIKGAAAHNHLVVGVMSGGSGNDFGRAYTSFSSVLEIEQYLKQQTISFQDLGMITRANQSDVFMNNCGFGIDAVVTTQVNVSTIKKYFNKVSLGKLAYVWILLRELYKFKRFNIELEIDGVKHMYEGCYFVVASNQPYFGGGMKISPKSNMEDGILELTVVNDIAKWRLLLIFATVFLGKHTRFKAVKQFQGRQFELKLDQQIVGHADGEHIGESTPHESICYSVKEKGWRLATLQKTDLTI